MVNTHTLYIISQFTHEVFIRWKLMKLQKIKKGKEKPMKLRITGTSEEVKELVELLPAILNVNNVSKEYPNRGSKEVRVYVDGAVEKCTFTTAIQKYAEVRNQLEGLFMVEVTSGGHVLQANAAINKRGFIIMMHHLTSEDFALELKENMEKFIQGKTHNESEDFNNAS